MLTRVNLPNPRPESWKKDNLIESKIKKKIWSSFSYQQSVERQNREKNWLKKDTKSCSGQPGLARQTYDSSHAIGITS
jgi:hypothetical protein